MPSTILHIICIMLYYTILYYTIYSIIHTRQSRTNVIPIIEDARHPLKYRMLMGMVDTIFADVAQPDQARIVALNASYFLKNEGHFVISIKASCIDSTGNIMLYNSMA